MKPALALAALMALGVTPATAQTPPPQVGPILGPEGVVAGTYTIDTNETLVRYSTIHMGLNEFWGTFPGATGTLTIDPKNIAAAKLEVRIPLANLETTNRELNAEFFSSEYFDYQKYRTMRFVSTQVTQTGPRTARVTGDLTIHGVTKPTVLNVTFNGVGPNSFSKVLTLGFKADGVVKRSDFGLGKYVPIVSDETNIAISAAFELKK